MSHQVIFHGRRVCHARKPACGACTLAPDCPSFGTGPTDPVEAAKLVKGPEPAAPAGAGRASATPAARTAAVTREPRAPRPGPRSWRRSSSSSLAVLAVVALWPSSAAPAGGAPAHADDRRRAGQRPRGRPTRPHWPRRARPPGSGPARRRPARPAAGPLAGVQVPCLGAHGRSTSAPRSPGGPRWSTCGRPGARPCRAELPALAEYAARPGAVPVLASTCATTRAPRWPCCASCGWTCRRSPTPTARCAPRWTCRPRCRSSYVVRADGSVTRVDPPTPFPSADEVAAAVERLS